MMKQKIDIKYLASAEGQKECIEQMLDFSPDQLINVHDKMYKLGYRGEVSDMDKKFFHYLGQRMYDEMSRGSFQYSCLEADYLRVDKSTPAFHQLCKINRHVMWECAKPVLLQAAQGASINNLEFITENEMRNHIRQKWKARPANLDTYLKLG